MSPSQDRRYASQFEHSLLGLGFSVLLNRHVEVRDLKGAHRLLQVRMVRQTATIFGVHVAATPSPEKVEEAMPLGARP